MKEVRENRTAQDDQGEERQREGERKGGRGRDGYRWGKEGREERDREEGDFCWFMGLLH